MTVSGDAMGDPYNLCRGLLVSIDWCVSWH